MTKITGTDLNDAIVGSTDIDLIVGAGGNDTLTGGASDDILIGDYESNLLQDSQGEISFADYAKTSDWTVTKRSDGQTEMSRTIETVEKGTYNLNFELANNFASGHGQGAIEVVWNGTVIGSYETKSGAFQDISVSLDGTGKPGELTFRTVDTSSDVKMDTSGPIFSYDKAVSVNGETITVSAFAEGQSNLYQVMNGTLMVFDPKTETYTPAGSEATVVVNAIGFNQEDDLIYGIAVSKGTDALGHDVNPRDLVMLDAQGNSYGLGATPYRSWTGDFDDKGNLWAFEADMDYFMKVDVSERDVDGNPVVTKFNLPDELIDVRVWDVAFDATTGTFQGVVRPSQEGADAVLITIDVSGAKPQFDLTPVTSTNIDGQILDGAPAITFGAAIQDSAGTLFVGGNSGDHDMNDATGSSGGFYRVDVNATSGEAQLVLVADAPRSASNDGAADPRALDPFTPVDPASAVFIRDISLVDAPDQAATFVDFVDGNAGADTLQGNLSEDTLVGSSAGDALFGGEGNDALYGGASPDAAASSIISSYDKDGQRYDQFGNLLEEDDDVLAGGVGDDLLHGSAGHDVLAGGLGQDQLYGGSGHDTLDGGDDADELFGGREDDALSGNAGDDALFGGSGNDDLNGGTGNDVLKGGSGADVLAGGDGADKLRGDAGDDVLKGGTGNDRMNGGSGADRLDGGDGKDYLNAGKGDDVLDGGAGKDVLYLGAGNDIATGGADSDRFVFRSNDLDGSTDRITDFARGDSENDRIDVSRLNLLDQGLTAEEWIAQSVSQTKDGGVHVDLGGCQLMFDARADGTSVDLFNDVTDGFIF